jgi:hypothetical protein
MSFGMVRNELPINGDAMPSIKVGKDWFRFFGNLWSTTTRGAVDPVTPITSAASPMVFAATARGQAIVSGGTVSAIALSRDGTNYFTTGLTAGVFPMSSADKLKITYTVVPTTLQFMPL